MNKHIPSVTLDYTEIAKAMKINIDILKKDLSDHVDSEIKRFKETIQKAQETNPTAPER